MFNAKSIILSGLAFVGSVGCASQAQLQRYEQLKNRELSLIQRRESLKEREGNLDARWDTASSKSSPMEVGGDVGDTIITIAEEWESLVRV